ncbi:MAG TPA: DNA methyltransferase [Rhodopila sp.]
MTLDLRDCFLSGSAMTDSFLRDGLAEVLDLQHGSQEGWEALCRSLRGGGTQRVHQRLTSKLASAFGYGRSVRQHAVATREGQEDGGWLLQSAAGGRLRAWSIPSGIDLRGPARSMRAYRSSPTRIAQRVLLAAKEWAGLLTDGEIIRLLICDPSRSDSHLSVDISGWRTAAAPPDSFRLLKGLAGADGVSRLPAVLEAARLHQVRVTTELRRQARAAIVGFINALPDRAMLDPTVLWHEGLVLVYRLLFILKLEGPAEPGSGFSFAATRLWREALSPNRALGPLVRRHLDLGHDTGQMLESGLRRLFAIFRDGLRCSELNIAPLAGALFAESATKSLDRLDWGERAVAIMLDRLIWIVSACDERVRVHYGSLDVEDLGSIYEGLLEQEPGIATEPLRRISRGRQEAFVAAKDQPGDIEPGQFYLRTGMGRKSSGSFYTPHEFVRFLVRETLDPQIAAVSPPNDPHPARLLSLKVVDPATGSGHFLVEACRHLGEAVLSACLLCDERGEHDRIAALPDADQTITAYLPSRGFCEPRARAICRREVAVHCLYGCDRNNLAVELAKLSLWLESYAEGLPLTFLDHRLVHGDALTGPFFASLATLPVTGGPLDPLLASGVADRLDAALGQARPLVTWLNASIGRDVEDLQAKQAIKDRLDRLLHPLLQLARTWAGAAMLRERDCDDVWLGLAGQVAAAGRWPEVLTPRQAAVLSAGADAVPWDLVFAEVFPGGFSAVLGNPPWDVVLPNTKDFVANYEPSVLDARTGAQRAMIEQSVLARPDAAAAFEAYRQGFERIKRVAVRLYRHQRVLADGETTAGNLDLFRLFAERKIDLTARHGAIGVLMPSAFHANEGTTGIRRLYLRETTIDWCLSFENRRRIFDIDSRFKFDLIVARRPGPTQALRCGFYLDRIEDAADAAKIMTYKTSFLDETGGTPLELRGSADLAIAETLFAQPERLGKWCAFRNIRFGNDLHMTADSHCFRPAGVADLVLHEGKTFHQYTDSRDTKPRYSVASDAIHSGVHRHYRLVFRDIARSNDERTMIACIAPPGTAFGHTATVEKTPWARSVSDALTLCAVFNSFPFDWLVRQKAATHLSLYLLRALPFPRLSEAETRFLGHAALRLSCNHAGYNCLWEDQGGGVATPAGWPLRAEVDAIVAHAYGLNRQQYDHVLRSFNHRACPEAVTLCLAAFDTARASAAGPFPTITSI